jgi:hypothetical protein
MVKKLRGILLFETVIIQYSGFFGPGQVLNWAVDYILYSGMLLSGQLVPAG